MTNKRRKHLRICDVNFSNIASGIVYSFTHNRSLLMNFTSVTSLDVPAIFATEIPKSNGDTA